MFRVVAARVFKVFALFTFFTLSFSCISFSKTTEDESINGVIWGPGLKTTFVVPARYFYIQAVDNNSGENITESLGEDAFQVSMHFSDGKRPRIQKEVLDRKDGSYLVRFKLYDSYQSDLTIAVTYKGHNVAESPYLLKGPLYGEKCFCPQPDMNAWLDDFKCSAASAQMLSYLEPFPEIVFPEVLHEAVKRFNQHGTHSIVHYVVLNNQIYRKTYGMHVGFKMFSDAILLSLARKVKLPDMEFLINLGDWPLVKKSSGQKPLPIISWCGSDETLDIVLPTYDVTESTLETMGRVTLDLLAIQAHTGPRWENKTDLAFWRGRDSRKRELSLSNCLASIQRCSMLK